MDLKEIMSVSGQSGLFRFVSQGRNGIIVESFTDKKRSFISASQKVSSLGDIAVFTDGDEVPLKDVLKKIHETQPGTPALDPKSSPEKLKAFMETILPEYDRDRVYVSDIKKLVTWYNTLLELKLLNFDEEKAPEAEASTDASVEAKPAAKEPKKPAAPKAKKTSTTRKAAAAGK
jgi:hypothetical protein